MSQIKTIIENNSEIDEDKSAAYAKFEKVDDTKLLESK